MADVFSMRFDSAAIDAALDQLGDLASQHLRPAAQAGAQVLYDEARLRCPVSKKPKRLSNGKMSIPGALKNSIYQVYSADRSNKDRATYHVSWNYRKAPHGHLIEFGTSRAPAHPFLRPAFGAKHEAAMQAAKTKFTELMQTAIASLS